MSRSRFHLSRLFELRHAWLSLWDKHITADRINRGSANYTKTPSSSMKAASVFAVAAHTRNKKFFESAQQRLSRRPGEGTANASSHHSPHFLLLGITAQIPKQNLLIVFLLEQRSSTVGRVHRRWSFGILIHRIKHRQNAILLFEKRAALQHCSTTHSQTYKIDMWRASIQQHLHSGAVFIGQ